MYKEQSLILVVQSQINQQLHHQFAGSVEDQYLLVVMEESWMWKDFNGKIVCGFRGHI